MIRFPLFLFLSLIIQSCLSGSHTPVLDSDWWQVASNPDLGEWSNDKQEPVDFAIWQAADGSWQLWSCIRKTNYPGRTRVFFRWEGGSLTDSDWFPLVLLLFGPA